MKKQVIVTTSWDDGHKLDLKLAALLMEYGIKGTFYIAPNIREWDKKDFLSNRQIKQLSQDFEIGAHTMNHAILSHISNRSNIRYLKNKELFKENLA